MASSLRRLLTNLPQLAPAGSDELPDPATRDDFAGGWSGVWDILAGEISARKHDAGSAG
jgi:hypothetical protein